MNRFAKGFTLIELMIVLAIVGILAAVIAPMVMDPPKKPVAQQQQAERATLSVECRYGKLFMQNAWKNWEPVAGPDGQVTSCAQ